MSYNLEEYAHDPWVKYAEQEIRKNYGDSVSVLVKSKSLLKFGENDNLSSGVEAMVWSTGGIEALLEANGIDTLSSSDVADSEVVTIEGHTIDGSGNLTFSVQTATLNGRNKVTLTTPVARVSRMYNAGGTDFVGRVTVYEDTALTNGVPSDETKIHCEIPLGSQQSFKAATSISSTDYWIITQVTFSVLKKTSAAVDFILDIKEQGGVFRERMVVGVNSATGTVVVPVRPHLIVPKNSDVRVTATSDTNATAATANVVGVLASVV